MDGLVAQPERSQEELWTVTFWAFNCAFECRLMIVGYSEPGFMYPRFLVRIQCVAKTPEFWLHSAVVARVVRVL